MWVAGSHVLAAASPQGAQSQGAVAGNVDRDDTHLGTPKGNAGYSQGHHGHRAKCFLFSYFKKRNNKYDDLKTLAFSPFSSGLCSFFLELHLS